MTFSEPLVVKFSGVVVTDGGGKAAALGPARAAADNRKQLIAPLAGKLEPGAYSVAWHAVSADTHRVQGRFSFTVD